MYSKLMMCHDGFKAHSWHATMFFLITAGARAPRSLIPNCSQVGALDLQGLTCYEPWEEFPRTFPHYNEETAPPQSLNLSWACCVHCSTLAFVYKTQRTPMYTTRKYLSMTHISDLPKHAALGTPDNVIPTCKLHRRPRHEEEGELVERTLIA
jgi:hypothetical protein